MGALGELWGSSGGALGEGRVFFANFPKVEKEKEEKKEKFAKV